MSHRIFTTSVASVYIHYVAKAAKGGHGRDAVDRVVRWQTGYSQAALDAALGNGTDFQTFFGEAPAMNPARSLVTGKVCGVSVQEVEDPLMREIRILDKMVDELAKGRAMERVLRSDS